MTAPHSRPLLAALAMTFGAAACAVGRSDARTQGTSSDAGSPNPLTEDAGSVATNPTLPDGAVHPHGTRLVPGSLRLDGVTADDFTVYVDVTSNVAHALSLDAGSTPVSLGLVAEGIPTVVMGTVVILGTSVDRDRVGAASIWVSTAVAPIPLASATLVGLPTSFAVSTDGRYIIFLDAVDTTAMTASIVAAKTDGTERSILVSEIALSNDSCAPRLGFAGSDFAITAFCNASPDDGGATGNDSATVSTYAAAAGWAETTIATGVRAAFAVDPGASRIVVQGPAGTQLFPIAGGTPVTLDAAGALGAQTRSPGVFAADGERFFYTTNGGAMAAARIDGSSQPTPLSDSGTFVDVLGVSPDGEQVVGASGDDASPDVTLLLAATSPPSDVVPLSSEGNIGLAGDLFTRDSSHVLYTVARGGDAILDVVPVDGGVPTLLGKAALQAFAVSGGMVVYGANFSPTVNDGEAAADLFQVDTTTGTPATLLVTQADPHFALNAARSVVVYTWSYEPGESAGLWATPLDGR